MAVSEIVDRVEKRVVLQIDKRDLVDIALAEYETQVENKTASLRAAREAVEKELEELGEKLNRECERHTQEVATPLVQNLKELFSASKIYNQYADVKLQAFEVSATSEGLRQVGKKLYLIVHFHGSLALEDVAFPASKDAISLYNNGEKLRTRLDEIAQEQKDHLKSRQSITKLERQIRASLARTQLSETGQEGKDLLASIQKFVNAQTLLKG